MNIHTYKVQDCFEDGKKIITGEFSASAGHFKAIVGGEGDSYSWDITLGDEQFGNLHFTVVGSWETAEFKEMINLISKF